MRDRRTQQEKRQAGLARRELQTLACLEVESRDRAADRGRHPRAQRFFERPQRLLFVPGLDQDQPRRIETEMMQAMAVRPAVLGEDVRRGDEQHRPRASMRRPEPREQRGEKPERGRRVAMLLRRDLMQGADRETALRQMRVEIGEAEGQGARRADALQARQQAAQLRHDRGAASAPDMNGSRGRRGHGRRRHGGTRGPKFVRATS